MRSAVYDEDMDNDQVFRYADVEQLGRALAGARRRAGLSQRAVSVAADVTPQWLNIIEHGRVQGADTTRLLAVAKAVGMDFALVPSRGPTGPEK